MMRKEALFLLLATPAFLFTRLFNLKIIPIFTDEAIYSFWAQVALHDPANRFISLEDGKQPLFIWIAAIFQKFISDPLIATRLVSVFAGLVSLFGIYWLARELFGKRVAMVSSLIYLVLPFTLLYDRLALFDSLLTALGIFSVILTIHLAKYLKLETALIAGFSIGLALITKSSGNFFLYFLPFTLLFFDRKSGKTKFLKWLVLAFLVFLISESIYNSLRLSPLFSQISIKNLQFIRSVEEVLKNPLQPVFSNAKTITLWSIEYIGIALFLAFLLSIVWGIYERNKNVLFLAILTFLPFFAEVVFNKVLYPRFILFYLPYAIILISYFSQSLYSHFSGFRKVLIAIFIIFLLQPLYSSFKLLTDPPLAKIPTTDLNQYINDWPAGYGVEEVKNLTQKESENKRMFVGTEGTFGLLPYALRIYFYSKPNVEIEGFWPVDVAELPEKVLEKSKTTKTYFVFNENQTTIVNPHLKLLERYQKGRGSSYMRLYEVVP